MYCGHVVLAGDAPEFALGSSHHLLEWGTVPTCNLSSILLAVAGHAGPYVAAGSPGQHFSAAAATTTATAAHNSSSYKQPTRL